MVMKAIQFILLAVGVLGSSSSSSSNPIAKVVQLLSELQAKVTHDGEVEQAQYEEFADWCKEEATAKKYEIADGTTKVEELGAVIEKLSADIEKNVAKIESLSGKISTDEADLKAAREIRSKEAKDFVASDAELGETVDMLRRAHGIIEKSMNGGSFMQMDTKLLTSTLQTVVNGFVFSAQDKDQLEALLQTANHDGEADDDLLLLSAPEPKAYESKSGAILETIEGMTEEAAEMRNSAQKAEMKAKFNFEMLEQSLQNSLDSDNKEMGETKKAKAAAEEAKSMAEGDLSMNDKALKESKVAMKDLSMDCQNKAASWDESQKSRAGELEALATAKKSITEKTGGATERSYEFVQVLSKTRRSNKQLVETLAQLSAQTHDEALGQLSARVRAMSALDSSNDVFGKIKGMIQDMMEKLLKEAREESEKKAFCDKEMSESEAKIEDHTDRLEELNTRADKASATIKKLEETIATLQSELGGVRTAQAEMDKMRQEEKTEFLAASKDLQDGVDGIQMALSVLRDYYSAKDDDSAALVQEDQPAVGTHSASTGGASGIIGMLEVAESDFTKNLAEAKADEESAQSQYEKVTQENKVSSATKETEATAATKQKASLEKLSEEVKGDIEGEQTELDAVNEYYAKLTPECVAKPEPYEERKKRREEEIEGLKNALGMLEAESPSSFLQRRQL